MNQLMVRRNVPGVLHHDPIVPFALLKELGLLMGGLANYGRFSRGSMFLPENGYYLPMAGICAFISQIVSPSTPIISLVALSLMAWTYIPTIRFFRLGRSRAFTLPIAGILYMAMTLSSAMNHFFGRHVWRGHRSRNAL